MINPTEKNQSWRIESFEGMSVVLSEWPRQASLRKCHLSNSERAGRISHVDLRKQDPRQTEQQEPRSWGESSPGVFRKKPVRLEAGESRSEVREAKELGPCGSWQELWLLPWGRWEVAEKVTWSVISTGSFGLLCGELEWRGAGTDGGMLVHEIKKRSRVRWWYNKMRWWLRK